LYAITTEPYLTIVKDSKNIYHCVASNDTVDSGVAWMTSSFINKPGKIIKNSLTHQ